MDVFNLFSGSSAFSKPSLNIWKSMVHVLLKPGLENLEHYFARVWDMYNCAVAWKFLALPFFGKGFLGGSEGKASACNEGDTSSVPRLGRSPGEGNGNPLQYSCLENSMYGGAWWATVHGVTKSWTRLSNFTCSLGIGWKLTFSSSVTTAEFSKFAGTLSEELLQHHLLRFEIVQLEFHHLL